MIADPEPGRYEQLKAQRTRVYHCDLCHEPVSQLLLFQLRLEPSSPNSKRPNLFIQSLCEQCAKALLTEIRKILPRLSK
jgi:hypothetical protein